LTIGKVPRRQRGKTSESLGELSLSTSRVLSVEETQQGEDCVGSPLPILRQGKKIMAQSRINSGEVSINFDNRDWVLRPTLNAATAINRNFDGFANARAALVRENFDAVVFILRLGLYYPDMTDKEKREYGRDLPEKVYDNGITAELLIPLIEYVAVLGNGGRPVNNSGGEEEEPASPN